MLERAYTVAEIDRMRRAVDHLWLFGCMLNEAPSLQQSRTYDETERTAFVEEMLRTYMLAGVGPEELEGPPRLPLSKDEARTREIVSGQTVSFSG